LIKTTYLFKKYFPNKIIFSALGNHEATPVNLYPTTASQEENSDWLYSKLVNDWIKTGLPNRLRKKIRK
jgi:sphingomyelin phosphodiesterase